MRYDDRLHAAVAAALVRAGYGFGSFVTQTSAGDLVRHFTVPFVLGEKQRYDIYGYVGGAALVALSPLRVLRGGRERMLTALEYLTSTMAFTRMFVDHGSNQALGLVVWVSAEAPLPREEEADTLPIDVAVAPFNAVSTGVQQLLKQFPGDFEIIEKPVSVPAPSIERVEPPAKAV